MNDDDSTPAGIRVNIIVLAFTLVSGLVVFLRLFTRLVISKNAGLEDACIVLAMVSEHRLLAALFAKGNLDLFRITYCIDYRTSNEWTWRA